MNNYDVYLGDGWEPSSREELVECLGPGGCGAEWVTMPDGTQRIKNEERVAGVIETLKAKE